MNSPLAFNEPLAWPALQQYEAAFRKATGGVSLKVLPPDAAVHGADFAPLENAFCVLAAGTPSGCSACLKTQMSIQRAAARKLVPQQIYCYAGLTVIAMPVVSSGRHLATLLSGQVFRREPTERDFAMVLGMLGGEPSAEWVKKVRKAYFETPVVTVDRFQAIVQLLNVFARFVADLLSHHEIARLEHEPEAVVHAKQFVESHAEEPITLAQVVRHANVSRFYFCKLFKRATGMTLTEYVSRVRVEKAKTLLMNPSLRVSEVVFAAGFGSVPQFNCVFKRCVGMAPSEYRASLRSPSQS